MTEPQNTTAAIAPAPVLPFTPFRYNAAADEWVPSPTTTEHPVLPLSAEGDDATRIRDGRPLRIATFNVLADCFPWFVRAATPPEERFAWLAQELPKLNADVIGLNEVTATTLRHLLGSPYVRANYYVTENVECRNSTFSAKLHGCVMLSRVPFAAAFVGMRDDRPTNPTGEHRGVAVTDADAAVATSPNSGESKQAKKERKKKEKEDARFGRAAVFGVFHHPASYPHGLSGNGGDSERSIGDEFFTVCSLHTLAYQSKENKLRREQQIGEAASVLRSIRVHGRTPRSSSTAADASSAAFEGVAGATQVPFAITAPGVYLGEAKHESVADHRGAEVKTGFIIGDLNMHYTAEDALVPRLGLIDCWAETHFQAPGAGHPSTPGPGAEPVGPWLATPSLAGQDDGEHQHTHPICTTGAGGRGQFTVARAPFSDQDPGITFDAMTNGMIKRYIPGEQRRMRLDRILALSNAPVIPTAPVQMWASTAIDASLDIWPSDHYGLVGEFLMLTPAPADVAAAMDRTAAPFVDVRRTNATAAGGQEVEKQRNGWVSTAAVQALLTKNGDVSLDTAAAFSRLNFALSLAPHVPWVIVRGLQRYRAGKL